MLAGQKIEKIPETIQTLMECAVLCSDATIKPQGKTFNITGDPTEVALIVAAAKAGIHADKLNAVQPRKDVIPFDSELQYMATLAGNADARIVVKGAPEA